MHRRSTAFVAVLSLFVLSTSAHAQSPAHTQLGVSFTMGGGSVSTSSPDATRSREAVGPSLTLRPELTLPARTQDARRLGLYGEVGTTGLVGHHDRIVGGGLSLVVPFGDHGTLTPSLGAFRRYRLEPASGIEMGVLLGGRERGGHSFIDAASGLRFDARLTGGPNPERTFILSIQGDLVAGVGMLGWLL